MKGTGIIATAEEIALLKRSLNTPAIALQCGAPASPQAICHSFALAHGLPEVAGFYGIDLGTGEFMAVRS